MNAPSLAPRTPSAASLILDGVHVRRGGTDVLNAVQLVLPLHARTVVLGPNGAGKTSLLAAIQGLMALDRGRIHGLAADGSELRFRTAFVFQKPVMLRRSVLQNLTHALGSIKVVRSQRRDRANAALNALGLGALADRPAHALSGGEQQRIAIARAEVLAPDCLLLDEPCAHLDPGAQVGVERLLLQLSSAGRGLVMSTHDLAQARRLADLVVFLHCGRVLEVTPAAQFFDAPTSAVARRFVAGEWIEDE